VVAFSEIPVGNAGATVQSSTASAAPNVAAKVVENAASTVAPGNAAVAMSMYSILPLGSPENRE
jgi:hypothetical protein